MAETSEEAATHDESEQQHHSSWLWEHTGDPWANELARQGRAQRVNTMWALEQEQLQAQTHPPAQPPLPAIAGQEGQAGQPLPTHFAEMAAMSGLGRRCQLFCARPGNTRCKQLLMLRTLAELSRQGVQVIRLRHADRI